MTVKAIAPTPSRIISAMPATMYAITLHPLRTLGIALCRGIQSDNIGRD